MSAETAGATLLGIAVGAGLGGAFVVACFLAIVAAAVVVLAPSDDQRDARSRNMARRP